MTAPEMLTMNCPSDETLALFVEGKLDGDARAAVIEHLTECADCRDIVLMATDEAAATTKNVTPIRRWLPYIAAAAAVLVLMFGAPGLWERFQRDDLRELNAKFGKRQVEARISIDGAHRDFRGRSRGKEDAEALAEYYAEEAEATAQEQPTQKNLHKAGLADLVALRHQKAVDAFERALTMGKSVDLLNDTAAAHLELLTPKDLERAIVLSDESLQLEPTPAALWNRALALKYLYRDREAIAAFQKYIAAEPDPLWDQEARDKIDEIETSLLPSRP